MEGVNNLGYSPYFGNTTVTAYNKGKESVNPPIDDNDESPFAEAIRLYKSYVLTGKRELTAEEKEEIRNAIAEYLESSGFLAKYNQGIATKADYAALNDFLKALCIKYGCPSDFYEFVADYLEAVLENETNPDFPQDPPFKVVVPPEHELISEPVKPLLASFKPISPFQFLTCDDEVNL